MKKSRVTALLTACAMVGSMVFGIVPGVYAEEVAPIKIEGESISVEGGKVVNVDGLSDGAALMVENTAGQNNIVSYTVPDVTKAGLYTMKLTGSRQGSRYLGDGALQWLSPYYIQVNDETPFTFTDNRPQYKELIVGDTSKGLGGANIQYGTFELPVYLHEGSNTVSFILKDSSFTNHVAGLAGATKAAMYIDCMEFTYQSRGSANLPIIVEGEEYAGTNVPEAGISPMTDPALSGGTALKILNEADITDGGYVDYTATAAKEGMYTLEFTSSVQGQNGTGGAENYSPFTVKVNDGNAIAFDSFSGYKQSATTVGGISMAKYSMEVHLQQGVNTIRFAIAKSGAEGNPYVFALDYLKLSPLTMYSADDFKVEGESFTRANLAEGKNDQVRVDNGLSNNKKAYFNSTTVAPELDYVFYVEEEGDYAVYSASQRNMVDWTSELGISVNGGETIPVDNETSEQVMDIATTSERGLMRLYAVKKTLVHLNKGYNTMTLSAVNTKKAGGSDYIIIVDYIRFVKAGTSVTQNVHCANYKNTGNRDDLLATTTKNMDLRYNGVVDGIHRAEFKTEKELTENAYAEHSFFVGEDGDYALTLDCGGNITGTFNYASYCGISIDGGELETLEAGTNVTRVGSIGTLNPETWGRWEYTLTNFKAGWHTLRFETWGVGSLRTDGKNFAYWQGFTLEKKADVETAALSFADPVITVGESTQAEITYLSATGNEVKPDGYTASWGSSNEKVADFDTEGRITAFNPGKTVITACISDADNNEVGQYSAELIVLPVGSTVFAQGASRDTAAKQINVRLSSFGDMPEDEAVSLIVSAHKKENGLPTTLKSVSLNPISGLKNGNNKEIAIPMEDLQADDTVTLYIWKGMNELVPLWTKDVIE